MKRLVLFFFFFPSIARPQLCIDFESGTLKDWNQSRDAAWVISGEEPLQGNYALRHDLDDSLSGEDCISFAYDSLVLDDWPLSWEFSLRHAYLPSSSNNWAVFLLSSGDQAEMRPGAGSEAILLGVNFKGSDDTLRLWRMQKGTLEGIAGTAVNWQETVGTEPATLRVEREKGGIWKIYLAHGAQDFKLIGTGRDTAGITPEHFGIYYRFTSRQDRKFWFDALCINGHFARDTVPPFITGIEIPDARVVRIFFSEKLDLNTALSPDNYFLLPGTIHPDSVVPLSESSLDIFFNRSFESGMQYTLRVSGMADRKGNSAATLEQGFTWYRPGPVDVVFNELMFDPSPPVGLPEYEYIELFNRCGFVVRMENWTLRAGKRLIRLPVSNLPPDRHLLLCYEGSGKLYPGSEHTLDLLGSQTLLVNEGSLLCLYDKDSVLIDWIEYAPGMHAAEYFGEGGWSLERIDPDRPCHAPDNWTSSGDRRGGTPGMKNSVAGKNQDSDPPFVHSVYLSDTHHLVLEFNEAMDPGTLLQASLWHLEGGPGTPDSIRLISPFNREIRLYYPEGFLPGKEYALDLSPEIRDCSGNPIGPGKGGGSGTWTETGTWTGPGNRIRFALPADPAKEDILLSEVLFNPLPFCPDYVELFNPSQVTFDLADLRLAGRDALSGEISPVCRITNGHRLFFPGQYIAVTEDAQQLCSCYYVPDPDCLVEAADLPSLGDLEGNVLVVDKYLEVIDEMHYRRDMHHPSLASPEGVSLERISFLVSAGQPSNWHSAASDEGYGTPGRRNSQYLETDVPSEGLELEPEIFTPDMDGDRDILLVKYRFRSPGARARILVLDPRGRLVREIANRQLLGTRGFFTWDGTDRQGRMADTGMYLILAEISGMDGRVRRYKKTCVLSGRQ